MTVICFLFDTPNKAINVQILTNQSQTHTGMCFHTNNAFALFNCKFRVISDYLLNNILGVYSLFFQLVLNNIRIVMPNTIAHKKTCI